MRRCKCVAWSILFSLMTTPAWVSGDERLEQFVGGAAPLDERFGDEAGLLMGLGVLAILTITLLLLFVSYRHARTAKFLAEIEADLDVESTDE